MKYTLKLTLYAVWEVVYYNYGKLKNTETLIQTIGITIIAIIYNHISIYIYLPDIRAIFFEDPWIIFCKSITSSTDKLR